MPDAQVLYWPDKEELCTILTNLRGIRFTSVTSLYHRNGHERIGWEDGTKSHGNYIIIASAEKSVVLLFPEQGKMV